LYYYFGRKKAPRLTILLEQRNLPVTVTHKKLHGQGMERTGMGTNKMSKRLTSYDPAAALVDDEETAFFMADAFETGDAAYIAKALVVVARAKEITAAKSTLTESLALIREVSQHERMAARFLNLKKTPPTANFDLPSSKDHS
jgi:probable addiction module antidote protein